MVKNRIRGTQKLLHSKILQTPGSTQQSPDQRKCCYQCDTEFNWFTLGRSQLCSRCSQRFCKACFGTGGGGKKTPSPKVCLQCLARMKQKSTGRNNNSGETVVLNGASAQKRQNLLATPAGSRDLIKASYVKFKGASSVKFMERFFVLRRNFCLYSYKGEEDKCALAMLPLAGCDVQQGHSDRLSFTIRHINRVYHVLCSNDSDHAEWMAALILSANAKFPVENQQQLPLAVATNHHLDSANNGGLAMRRSSSMLNRLDEAESWDGVGDKGGGGGAACRENGGGVRPMRQLMQLTNGNGGADCGREYTHI